MKDKLKSQIAQGEIEAVLQWLLDHSSDASLKDLSLSLISRWNHLKNLRIKGTITETTEVEERNSIRDALISLLSKIDFDSIGPNEPDSSQNQQFVSSKIDLKDAKIDTKGGDLNIGGIINK